MTTLAERMDNLPTARRKKVEERANALIAEEMSLQDLLTVNQRWRVMTGDGCPVLPERSGAKSKGLGDSD